MQKREGATIVMNKSEIGFRFCECHDSSPGKISTDIDSHEPGCHIRKKLQTGRYTVSTSVIPKEIRDGFVLGVVRREEKF
jgi:hypothetical protein